MKQKVVLVTGGSKGIGKEIVQSFLDSGWQVATCARTSASLADSKAQFTFTCDIQNIEQVKTGIKKVVEKFGKIDVLINNAGIAGTNPLSPESSDELWHNIVNTNLNGTYYMCKYVLPYLPNKQGRIINISSVLGLKGVPDQVAYCAAKHGVIGLTRSLALYVAERGITVNAICPGWVDTGMAHERFVALNTTKKDIQSAIPLSQITSPQEIAQMALYLVTSYASNITGQTFTIDGGQCL
ncbi:SDR family NAD(P)-dependent oxidoreductase [Candidatus Uabimicrobium sp. HlEnr_7]|uniref:SDR family NAD(P)-dependent oxidoreductase n=1 Tax=Candidatus Uabimicrobium helgolandensis TaxID=3095367 RepID=UPI0035560C21